MFWQSMPGAGYPGIPGGPGCPGYPGCPGIPGFPEGPWGPYYPDYPPPNGQMDYETIERRILAYNPEIVEEAYPFVERVLNERDDPWRCPVPPRSMVDEMAEEVLRRWRPSGFLEESQENIDIQQRRRLLLSLVTVLLLSELLRRRRRIYR
ncbi:MAG: hypothetical protein ACOX3A_01535 [bacterium]|jgi:hypothetical protein